jgi:hypothetical protein
MAALDSSFPKKGDEENKISVDIINDDMALSEAFKKMTVDEDLDGVLNKGDDGDDGDDGVKEKRKEKFNKFYWRCFF